jgi:hypothetical protein
VSGVSFDDLVAVAALGVSRKGFAAAELDGLAAGYAGVLDARDPAAALLDAAALLTVAGRAGVLPPRASRGDGHDETAGGGPATGLAGDAIAWAGRERELSARGGRLLARLGGLDRQRGTVVKDTVLLADLLIAMRDADYVLPAPLLPALLDIASHTAALRPLAASVLGPRGVWLAGHRTDWREVADAGPAVGAPRGGRARPAGAGRRAERGGTRARRAGGRPRWRG